MLVLLLLCEPAMEKEHRIECIGSAAGSDALVEWDSIAKAKPIHIHMLLRCEHTIYPAVKILRVMLPRVSVLCWKLLHFGNIIDYYSH